MPAGVCSEEERSARSFGFYCPLWGIVAPFYSDEDSNLGLFGAFGYDLAFQFDPIEFMIARPDDPRDLVLYLPDSILVVDHYTEKAWIDHYDFTINGRSTMVLLRETTAAPFIGTKTVPAPWRPSAGRVCRVCPPGKREFQAWRPVRSGSGLDSTLYNKPCCHFAQTETDKFIFVFLLHQSGKSGISGRCLTGNVHACFGTAG